VKAEGGKPESRTQGWTAVYRVVRRIPAGSVSTYGRVAELAGLPRAARQVGWALSALGFDDDVPWHRVINARGEISRRGDAREIEDLQRSLLASEGVDFDRRGRIDLSVFGWSPRARTRVGCDLDSRNESRKDSRRESRKETTKETNEKSDTTRKRAASRKSGQRTVQRGALGTAGAKT
jgi:methylated-DNA-protein-cysteine methyltransferase-like protein